MGALGGWGGGVRAVGALTRAAADAARVLRPDASEGQRLAHAAWRAALDQHGAEFAAPPAPSATWFDRAVNGLNRLPRPLLAFGTLGLFVYAMVDPAGFAPRMAGLALVPEPLWWLLGAIVGFYFGARELHHRRAARGALPDPVLSGWHVEAEGAARAVGDGADGPGGAAEAGNAALAEWRAR